MSILLNLGVTGVASLDVPPLHLNEIRIIRKLQGSSRCRQAYVAFHVPVARADSEVGLREGSGSLLRAFQLVLGSVALNFSIGQPGEVRSCEISNRFRFGSVKSYLVRPVTCRRAGHVLIV